MRLMPHFSNYFYEDGVLNPFFKRKHRIITVQTLRQHFSFLLSFILLVNAIGYYPVFKIKQWQVHEEMKMLTRVSLPDNQLSCLAIANDDQYKINWAWEWEEEKEFTYQGNRYDVVRTNVSGDTTYYYCIQDTQETLLFAQLDKEVEQKMNDQKNPLQGTAKKMMKIFSSLIFQTVDYSLSHQALFTGQHVDFQHDLYQCDFFNLISPPPKHLPNAAFIG